MIDAKILSLLAATLVLVGTPTMAQEMDTASANFMLPYCHEWLSGKQNAMSGVCAGVVSGIFENSEKLDAADRSCSPPGASRGQAISVVIKYLDENPDKWNQRFSVLVIAALRLAWPCN